MSPAGPNPAAVPAKTMLDDAYRRVLDNHSILSIADAQGIITHVNDAFCTVLGYTRDELVGRSFADINVPDLGGTAPAEISAAIDNGTSWAGQVCNRSKTGTLLWFQAIIVPLFDAQGALAGRLSIRHDISERIDAEKQLARSQQFLLDVSEMAQIGGWSLDTRTGELYWSDQTKRIHDLPDDYEPKLEEAINFYAPEARAAITHAVETAIGVGEGWKLELPLITAKDRSIWVRALGHPVYEDGDLIGLMGTFQDITEIKLSEDLLREEVSNRHSAEQLLRDVLETLPDAVAAYDSADRLIVCNSAYLKTYAASADAIVPGATFESILRFGLSRGQYGDVGPDAESQEAWLKQRLAHHKNPPEQLTQRLSDGRWLQVREHRSGAGTTVGVRTDITSLKRAESELRRYAEMDPLTGLLNRRQFTLRLGEVLEKLESGAHAGGCIALFDLDYFKPINDAYGHDIGDEVLVEVAYRLKLALGKDDFAARLGGDEFIFAMSDRPSQADYEDVIVALFDAMREPILTSVGKVTVSLSLGVTEFTQRGLNPQMLMKFADLAQYQAKAGGRGRWHWFTKDDADRHSHEGAVSKALATTILTSLDTARETLSFRLSPIADAQTGTPLGFAGEVAWFHSGGWYDSDQMFALAQRSGQVAKLCSYVVDAVMSAVGDAQNRGADVGELWLSVSPDHVRLQSFVAEVEKRREACGLRADQITIAVSEAAFAARSSGAIEQTYLTLGKLGYRVGIDLFGTAASSLALMERTNIHAVRLDPTITNAFTEDDADERLLRGLVAMASALDIDVLATNVATPRQAARLTALGVGALQGPLVSDPVELDALPTHLADSARRQLASLLANEDTSRNKARDKSAA